ncbi:GAP family protein [Microbacterium sp. C23T]
MELLADAPLALTLGVLALLDGLSVGTLLVPIFLLLAPGRTPVGRVLLYLGTIATFYLAVGILFMLGLVNLVDVAQGFLSSPAGQIVRLVAGAALLLVAFLVGRGSARAPGSGATGEPVRVSPVTGLPVGVTAPATVAAAPSETARSEPSARLVRWRDRLLAPEASRGAVMAVAVGAGVVEVATMLPYLVAMGMLAEAPLGMPVRIAALAGYCAVMILPAVVLLVLRVVAAPVVERPLGRLAAWMERTGRENTAWILGIVGFLVARGAATELGLFDRLGALLG